MFWKEFCHLSAAKEIPSLPIAIASEILTEGVEPSYTQTL